VYFSKFFYSHERTEKLCSEQIALRNFSRCNFFSCQVILTVCQHHYCGDFYIEIGNLFYSKSHHRIHQIEFRSEHFGYVGMTSKVCWQKTEKLISQKVIRENFAES